MKYILTLILIFVLCGCCAADLSPTLRDGAVKDVSKGFFVIKGKCPPGKVYIRVMSAKTGKSTVKAVNTGKNGEFAVRYPFGSGRADADFYVIDASADTSFSAENTDEAAVIAYTGSTFPELPSAFTNDLLDSRGRTDRESKEYPVIRALINSFMNSRGAALSSAGKRGFDLDNPEDMAYFKKNMALYDFAHRDINWSQPLGHRKYRCLWQSVWPAWYNSSNDHPLDGNPNNGSFGNYMPYVFSNDFSDMLIMYLMRLSYPHPFDDNLREMCSEGTGNLMCMQNIDDENLAVKDHRGIREKYTKGAFRYGMFINGDYMTEGTGWFYNPAFLDYANGGVLNGRCIWALCESVPLYTSEYELPAERIGMALQFCLRDGRDGGYTKTTEAGNTYWRDAGEHAYLALGLARCVKELGDYEYQGLTIRSACIESLNALCDLFDGRQWSRYPNVDSMAAAALAEGCIALPKCSDAPRWRKTAEAAADYWINLYVRKSEFAGEVINFGLALAPNEMSYCWGRVDANSWKSGGQFFYYQTGHWLHALARLYKVTHKAEYLRRCDRMIAYLLGDNPLHIRIFNETGGVYNWTEDTDRDGVEDRAFNNMYPESTAFCQIGIMHYFDAVKK